MHQGELGQEGHWALKVSRLEDKTQAPSSSEQMGSEKRTPNTLF